jgi:hypothetical protein
MTADVPLICDPPPGGLLIVTFDGVLTFDMAEHLRAVVQKGLETGVLIIDQRVRIEHIPSRSWPDAEFCAA